jgi:fatty acid desaturase
VIAAPERISRTARDAADQAQAAQAAAETARFERMEQRIRRTIHALSLIMATLWLAGLGTIAASHWLGWP